MRKYTIDGENCFYRERNRIQNTEYRIQNTEYRIQNTGNRIQETELRITDASGNEYLSPCPLSTWRGE